MARIVNLDQDGGRTGARDGASLADQAYDAIKQRIFNFDLMPGDRLSETDLADRIQVSRTPLRQALQRLQHEALVEAIPKVGWMIPRLNFDKFDALYDFRVLIECYAVRGLSSRPGERPDLQKLARTWQCPVKERLQDAVRVAALDEDFHCCLVEFSGNAEMLRTYREITDRVRIIRRLDFIKSDRVSATYDEHGKIIAAIQKRRADEAERLLRAHIEQSKIEVRKITLDMLYQARSRALGGRKG